MDINGTELDLHSGDTTASRGRIEHAAVVLGEESAAVALLDADIALADAQMETYTVRNIDFANTTITALAGTIAHVSGILLDAGLLSLPETAPGSYTFNILLQDFSAVDASPLVGIINTGWETESAYTQSVSDRGVIVSFSLSSVPEPATATLSLLALAGLAMRRRRH